MRGACEFLAKSDYVQASEESWNATVQIVEAPKDLVDSYFEAKRRALEAVLNHVKFNGKVHLDFKNDDRKRVRDGLLKGWKYSKHYVDSAVNSSRERNRAGDFMHKLTTSKAQCSKPL